MKKKIILAGLAVIVLVAVIGYNYLYQDHREIATEKPVAELTSESIVEIFKLDDSNEILNATVTVKGKVTEISDKLVILDDNVACLLNEASSDAEVGAIITLKGRVTGYDDLFEQVKMDQCTLLNN